MSPEAKKVQEIIAFEKKANELYTATCRLMADGVLHDAPHHKHALSCLVKFATDQLGYALLAAQRAGLLKVDLS